MSNNEIQLQSFFQSATKEFGEQFFETAIENAYDSIIITSASPIDGQFPVIVYANKTSSKISGYTNSELIGKTPRILQGEKTDKKTIQKISRGLKNWETIDVEVLNYKKNGTEFWSHLTITPIKDKSGIYTHWLSIQRDITYKKKIEDEIRYNEERLNTVINAMNSGVWEWDIKQNTLFWNDKIFEILGYIRDNQVVKFDFLLNIIHEEDKDRFLDEIKNHLENNKEFNIEFKMKKFNGEYIFMNFTGLAKRDSMNVPFLMTGSATDITTTKLYQVRVEYLAYHDTLTGLGNRTKLEKNMFTFFEETLNINKSLALIFIDLDGFKFINDNYGHEIGDVVLVSIALRLKEIVPFSDSIYRLGGDEFLVAVKNFPSKEFVIDLAEKIKFNFSQKLLLENLVLETGASIGIAFYPDDSNQFNKLLRKADRAMYEAKSKGKNQVYIYSESLESIPYK